MITREPHFTIAGRLGRPDPDDAEDRRIISERLTRRDQLPGPRVGDFIVRLDGRLMRFSYDWGDSLQVSDGGSFYLEREGFADFSGGLEPSIPKRRIKPAPDRYPESGSFWIFHHDEHRAHNGVDFHTPCRMFEETAS